MHPRRMLPLFLAQGKTQAPYVHPSFRPTSHSAEGPSRLPGGAPDSGPPCPEVPPSPGSPGVRAGFTRGRGCWPPRPPCRQTPRRPHGAAGTGRAGGVPAGAASPGGVPSGPPPSSGAGGRTHVHGAPWETPRLAVGFHHPRPLIWRTLETFTIQVIEGD